MISTWPEILNDFLKNQNFTGYSDKCVKIASKIIDLKNLSAKASREKFDFVMNSVKANFSWNKKNAVYASKSSGEFLKDSTGNNADINLFTVGMLKACGYNGLSSLVQYAQKRED